MMLTPEQLAELREDFAGHNRGLLKSEQQSLFAHIDAQQARIDELEENAGAHALAMKAGKAMLQAETELADKAEAERDHWKANHDNLVLRARLLIEREDLPLERVKAYQRMQELEKDAERYRWLMANYARGDGWQQIDDALNYGEADTKLSPAIDAAMQK